MERADAGRRRWEGDVDCRVQLRFERVAAKLCRFRLELRLETGDGVVDDFAGARTLLRREGPDAAADRRELPAPAEEPHPDRFEVRCVARRCKRRLEAAAEGAELLVQLADRSRSLGSLKIRTPDRSARRSSNILGN
jgi:hypothetical protein